MLNFCKRKKRKTSLNFKFHLKTIQYWRLCQKFLSPFQTPKSQRRKSQKWKNQKRNVPEKNIDRRGSLLRLLEKYNALQLLFSVLLRLRETYNTLQLPVFFFYSFFCLPCPEYRSKSYPRFRAFSWRQRPRLLPRLPHPSKNGFGHFKEQLKRQARVVLRKKLFLILYQQSAKLIET